KEIVDERKARAAELAAERSKLAALLQEMLPPGVVEKVQGLSTLAEELGTGQMFELLDRTFEMFDQTIAEFGGTIYKVEIVGTTYFAASGVPNRNPNHASEIAKFALKISERARSLTVNGRPDLQVKIRIGINTGPCVAGIVGTKSPHFVVLGDVTNCVAHVVNVGFGAAIAESAHMEDLGVSTSGAMAAARPSAAQMTRKDIWASVGIRGGRVSPRRHLL
ncbi:nucleotide cyclase, partial [Blyttiomyces helicus]